MFKLKFIGLALLGLLAVGCSSLRVPPTDKSMEEKFRANGADFNKLITMFREDKLSQLTPETAYIELSGNSDRAIQTELTPLRMEEYRRLLRQVGAEGIDTMNQAIILYVFTNKGEWVSQDYREKSYVYSQTPLSPIVGSLDQNENPHIGYKKISDDWYLRYVD